MKTSFSIYVLLIDGSYALRYTEWNLSFLAGYMQQRHLSRRREKKEKQKRKK